MKIYRVKLTLPYLLPIHFDPRWHIRPPHSFPNDSCLVLQYAPHSRTANLLFSTVRLHIVLDLSLFLFPSGNHVRAVIKSLSGSCHAYGRSFNEIIINSFQWRNIASTKKSRPVSRIKKFAWRATHPHEQRAFRNHLDILFVIPKQKQLLRP